MKKKSLIQGTSSHGDLKIDISSGGVALVQLAGNWKLGETSFSDKEIRSKLIPEAKISRVSFDSTGLKTWDSILITLLLKIKEYCIQNKVRMETDGLPEGAQRLLMMAGRFPVRKEAQKEKHGENIFSRIGSDTIRFISSLNEVVAFVGEAFVAFIRFFGGKASFRMSDLGLFLQECGSQAFLIVSLINILVGLILAFIGAVQLRTFGAEIYVADLVGIAMVRVMGAVMTGIIMSGRTGAAFAAQLGTMQVNEEIDALRTLGVSPMEFLVLPRVLALTLMMPFLCLYADLMGVLGGMFVGVVMLGINPIAYMNQTIGSISLTNLWIGLFHSVVFGLLIALSGCLRGLQCGRSASEVGYATTSAVVTGIISCIIATAVITVLCNSIGI